MVMLSATFTFLVVSQSSPAAAVSCGDVQISTTATGQLVYNQDTSCLWKFGDNPPIFSFWSQCRPDGTSIEANAPEFGANPIKDYSMRWTQQVFWRSTLYRWQGGVWAPYQTFNYRWDHILPYLYWDYHYLGFWKAQPTAWVADRELYTNLPAGYYQVRYSYSWWDNAWTERGWTGYQTLKAVRNEMMSPHWVNPLVGINSDIWRLSTNSYCYIP